MAARCLTYKKVPIDQLESLNPAAAPEAAYFPGAVPDGTTAEPSIIANVRLSCDGKVFCRLPVRLHARPLRCFDCPGPWRIEP